MASPSMLLAADRHIRFSLQEDMNAGDLSTDAVMPEKRLGSAQLICKQDGTLAGMWVFERVFQILDPSSVVEAKASDGEDVKSGQLLAVVEGDVRTILSGERTALNYLQHMSGIATYARKMSNALKGTGIVLLDTRKTTPGMRIFEKYASRIGGAVNHRFNLSDAVMLKDNHIAAAGGIANAVSAARARAPYTCKVEVEAETLDQVEEAVSAGADIIMLDNMGRDDMERAVQIIGGRAQVECSGNVTLENVGNLAGLGIDYVSCGAITHSAGILDISLKNIELGA
ncbi:MAG: carboxylating nicotinate-nucleotide diphosphorylase [Coriobacteriales bacterium]|jgi:nicotinate-nucleotide pyrophosphorylase (carboxylating)